MRILALVLAFSLLASLGGCDSVTSPPEARVVDGTYIVSRYDLAGGQGTNIRLAGKSFHITQDQITWDRGGSLQLSGNWGLLELRASSDAIDINLDGVKLAAVAK